MRPPSSALIATAKPRPGLAQACGGVDTHVVERQIHAAEPAHAERVGRAAA